MKILNITQHKATKEQISKGVIEPSTEDKDTISDLITFNDISETKKSLMVMRATNLAKICQKYNCDVAMIGGAGYFLPTLVSVLKLHSIDTVQAFTKRITEEKDGVKTSKFVFEGFVS